jgi:hypothetical protein
LRGNHQISYEANRTAPTISRRSFQANPFSRSIKTHVAANFDSALLSICLLIPARSAHLPITGVNIGRDFLLRDNASQQRGQQLLLFFIQSRAQIILMLAGHFANL